MTYRIVSAAVLTVAVAACAATSASSSEPTAPSALPPAEPGTAPSPDADHAAALAPPGATQGERQIASADSTESPAEGPPELPKGTRVLHIGDSMAGALGIALNRQLEEAGLKGKLRYETASFIPTWAWSDKLPVYLAQHDPDLVLISLGTNELQIDEPERRAKTIQRLVKRLEGRPCVWIAPPHLDAGDNGLREIIRDNCAPCGYMNTDAAYEDMPRTSDKIHPTMAAREEWARRVIAWLAEHRRPLSDQPWNLDPQIVPQGAGPSGLGPQR